MTQENSLTYVVNPYKMADLSLYLLMNNYFDEPSTTAPAFPVRKHIDVEKFCTRLEGWHKWAYDGAPVEARGPLFTDLSESYEGLVLPFGDKLIDLEGAVDNAQERILRMNMSLWTPTHGIAFTQELYQMGWYMAE